MTLTRRRELALVVEALCVTFYETTGRQVWSHHTRIAFWLAFRMETSRDRGPERWMWLTAGGSA